MTRRDVAERRQRERDAAEKELRRKLDRVKELEQRAKNCTNMIAALTNEAIQAHAEAQAILMEIRT